MKHIIIAGLGFFAIALAMTSCGGGKAKEEAASAAKSDSTMRADSGAKVYSERADSTARADSVAPTHKMKNGDSIVSKLLTKATSDTNFWRITVYYGTDRKKTGSSDPAMYYGGDLAVQGYETGTTEVSIPKIHTTGKIEKPPAWKFWNRKDPAKYILSLRVQEMEEAKFYARLKALVDSTDAKDAFVFIHGFKNTFDEAAQRTAQLSHDLKFKGVPIMFSWPSKGKVLGYGNDSDQTSLSVPHLVDFLSKVLSRSGARKMHLIAHSMGNLVLTKALGDLKTSHPNVYFNEIILAAPDIYAREFKEIIAPKMMNMSERITVYSSSHDRALMASKKIHQDLRVGETIITVAGIETIDASNVPSDDWFDHAYFAQSKRVLDDISTLIDKNLPPQDKARNLLEQNSTAGRYWAFRK